jgi:Ca2+/Na+ antiporter
MLKVANSIHTRDKLVQIMLTFLIIGITVIWFHSFIKLTNAKEKCTIGLLLNILLCFVYLYLLFYSSYIPHNEASDDPTNKFVNNLFNSSGGSSNDDGLGCKLGYVDVWIYVVELDADG